MFDTHKRADGHKNVAGIGILAVADGRFMQGRLLIGEGRGVVARLLVRVFNVSSSSCAGEMRSENATATLGRISGV